MAEKAYIERSEALDTIRHSDSLHSAYMALAKLRYADVRPVVRGKWTSVFDIGTVCNQCGYDIEEHGYDVRTDGEPNFCPNCGADLREQPKVET